MTRFGFVVFACAALCGAAWAAESVDLKVTAVRATVENKSPKVVDKKLEPFREKLTKLNYDTFTFLSESSVKAEFGKETRAKINDRYTLCVTPQEHDAQNRIKMEVRIEEKPPAKRRTAPGALAFQPSGQAAKPRNAVKTTVHLAAPDKITFHGLELDQGKLVLVIGMN